MPERDERRRSTSGRVPPHNVEAESSLLGALLLSFFFIGLDYQAEHHLFPKIPHKHLPKAAAITADWCKRNGVVHLSVPYLWALVDAAKFMAKSYQRNASAPLAVRAGLIDDGPQQLAA